MATDHREEQRGGPEDPPCRRPLRWSLVRLAVVCAAVGVALAASAVPFGHERADLPVPRRIDYEWMSVEQWLGHHERLSAAAADAAADDPAGARIVWLGDSITEWWPRVGEESWSRVWQPRGSLNLALGGDSTQHLLWRLHHATADGLRPEVVVVAIGTNNLHLSRHTDEQVVAGVFAVVTDLGERFPAAQIVVGGILPRGRRAGDPIRSRILRINRDIAVEIEDRPRVTFIDAGHVMLEPDGTIDRSVMRDFLHLTEEGYRRWADQLLPVVDSFLGGD